MSRQATNRSNAIDQEFREVVKKSQAAVSELTRQTAEAKLFITFLHDNILNSKGDLSEGDRVDLRNAMVPLFPQMQAALAEVAALFAIYDTDLTVYANNQAAYLTANPNVLAEAL